MANINKVIRRTTAGDEVLIDLTGDSVAPEALFEGETAKNAAGETITGTFTITDEIIAQDSLIAQIKDALQGKATGGQASYDTCTVNISSPGGSLYGYAAICFDGTEIYYNTVIGISTLGAVTLSDVVCGSILSAFFHVMNGVMTASGCEILASAGTLGAVFIAPNNAGAVGTIDIGQSGDGAE